MALLRQSLAEIRIAHGEWTPVEATSLVELSDAHRDVPTPTECREQFPLQIGGLVPPDRPIQRA